MHQFKISYLTNIMKSFRYKEIFPVLSILVSFDFLIIANTLVYFYCKSYFYTSGSDIEGDFVPRMEIKIVLYNCIVFC